MEKQLWAMVPQEHIDFAQQLLANAGVPEWPDGSKTMGLMGWTDATATPLLEEALTRPKCKLIANALGTPPAEKIKQVKDSGRLIGALCGKVKQAVAHKEAGLDFVIAQGGEGGGHTGDVGSIVLWPQIRRRHSATCPCWPPAASAMAARLPPPWPWVRPASGPAPSG